MKQAANEVSEDLHFFMWYFELFIIGILNYLKTNTMKKLLLVLLFMPFIGISQKACNVFGKVKFVEYGEDYKVKFVDYGEDIKFKYVSYGEDKIGKWKAVDYWEDYKLKVVKYGEDFKAKEVDYGEGCN